MATKKKAAAAAKKPAAAAKPAKDKKPSKKSVIIEYYQKGKTAKEIIELTKFPKNTVEGAINHWRNEQALSNTGKVFDAKGNLVMKKKAEKASPVAKKKAAKKSPKKKVATKAKK